MRPLKFVSIIACVTICSLIYVWLQTEIFHLAYEGQKCLAVADTLVDKNTVLRYNIQRKASLVQIGSKMRNSEDFNMPDTCRLVKLAPTGGSLAVARQSAKGENLFARMFGVNRQAEAKTIGP